MLEYNEAQDGIGTSLFPSPQDFLDYSRTLAFVSPGTKDLLNL